MDRKKDTMTTSARRTRSRRRLGAAGRGQAVTELALIAPLLAIILFGIVEVSGAYGAKMDLQTASAQAARTGALEGNNGSSGNCAASLSPKDPALQSGPNAVKVTNDFVDRDIVKAVLNTHGIIPNNISQIQVFDATADGSVYGTVVNTYIPPFLTTAFSGTQAISGATYAAAGAAPGWPSCQRKPDEQSDSLGVHVSYKYHPITPLFGQATLTMNDQTVQHLNPSQNANPCPIPGIPFPVTAAVADPGPLGSPNPNDVITWNQVPGAQTYRVYASVDGAAYTEIYSGPGTVVGNDVQYTYSGNTTFAPTRYEVAGYNVCGVGQSSVPAPDGQCPLPVAPQNLTVADSATGSNHDLTWSAVPDKSGVYGQYTIAQTIDGVSTTFIVDAPATNTTVGYSDPSYAPVQYTVSYTSACGVAGTASAAVTTQPTPPPALQVSSTDGQAFVRPGDTLSYTLNVTNTAPQAGATAQSVVMTDTLPTNVTYANNSCSVASPYNGSSCTYDPTTNSLIVTLNKNVPIGDSNAGSVTFRATVNANATGTVANLITLTANNAAGRPQPVVYGGETDTVVLEPAMAVGESDTPASNYKANTTVTYTVSFTNTAAQPSAVANSVVVTDTFTNISAISASTVNAPYASGSSCTITSPKVVCTVNGTVPPGASNRGTITITATVKTTGTPLNSSVQLSSADAGGQQLPWVTATDNH